MGDEAAGDGVPHGTEAVVEGGHVVEVATEHEFHVGRGGHGGRFCLRGHAGQMRQEGECKTNRKKGWRNARRF